MERLECPRCGAGDIIQINHSSGGEKLTFSNCHVCEHRWWSKDGETITLPDVLDLAKNKKR